MKTVHYSDLGYCVVGAPADVRPIDHPDVPKNLWCKTTKVQAKDNSPNGPIFSTLNTLYVPCETTEEQRKATVAQHLADSIALERHYD